MKILRYFLLCVSLFFAITASAQEKVVPKYRINGHYFTAELPTKDVFGLKKTISLIKDDAGNRVINVIADDKFTIPEAFKKYEIPAENVKNMDQLEEKGNTMSKMNQLTHSGNAPIVGQTLGEFNEKDLNGKVWCNDSMHGHVAVINIWYSGCGPCRKEMPILSEWKDKYPDVLFLSANFEDAEKVKVITDKEGFNWNHLVNDTFFTKMVGNDGYPLTIVLDKDGIVRYFKNGTNEDIRKEILNAIESLK